MYHFLVSRPVLIINIKGEIRGQLFPIHLKPPIRKEYGYAEVFLGNRRFATLPLLQNMYRLL